ncbi:hypothetical protein AB0C12_36025 [Actinoplanes sp. NPDC048967]|uniref:hypothetical protein n=1 Tax=Actinoplanes sp. NPDC048967 TaxID=3155269 RepID=UPI0033DF90D5
MIDELLGWGSPTLRYLLLQAGPQAARQVTWRDSSRRRNGRPVPMSSRFVFQRVRPAGPAVRTAHLGQDLPEAWLIAKWPAGAAEPVKYWLSNLPATTAKRSLIRLAKLRWRIEHDGLRQDHDKALLVRRTQRSRVASVATRLLGFPGGAQSRAPLILLTTLATPWACAPAPVPGLPLPIEPS